MKSGWMLLGWFIGNAFAEVDLHTYDGCLGEEVVYNCTASFVDPPPDPDVITVGVYVLDQPDQQERLVFRKLTG